ncbi:hypothetical protein P171DRAFT_477227 [Karstenula rhodostoma CBS 690.94]|uniref:Uncharacterized protein n=1 Tax=Karstenula rhodostoma CBS 690.94 TaxID=1392251 RepID=A0A9P4P9G2_9PLEO|nr:hypothetical protein P171DRAFT_477227 [Karstenula rhodostoma CBS 690.94]
MATTPAFERLQLALQNRLKYPQNTFNLLGQLSQNPTPAPYLAAMELSVKYLVLNLRKSMTDEEAKKIGLLVMGNLQPKDIVSTRWIAEPSSRVYRTEQLIVQEGPHSVFLDQLVKSETLFHQFVCAVLLKSTRPDLTILQLITMALMDNEDIADETEMRVWIMDRIPFHNRRAGLEVALDIHNELTNFFETPKQILHLRPIDPALALRGQGAFYRQEQKGRVWQLAPGGEHHILKELYAEGNELLWNHPRAFLESQNEPKAGQTLDINGQLPPTLACLRKLDQMPSEMLGVIGTQSALSNQTIYPRITQDAVGFFQIEEVSHVDPTGLYAQLPRGRHGYRERSVDLQLALPSTGLLDLQYHIRKQFFFSNHWMLKDSFAATQVDIFWGSTEFLYDGGIPYHQTFRMLSQIRGLQEVKFSGLDAYPELEDELTTLMTSPRSLTRPNFSFLQVIVLALVGAGDMNLADETEIRDWIAQNIPFYAKRSTLQLTLDVYEELTDVFESGDRVLEPIDLATRDEGLEYEQGQKGLVWRLPTANEHRIFHNMYAPGHELLWNHSRLLVLSPNMPYLHKLEDAVSMFSGFARPRRERKLNFAEAKPYCGLPAVDDAVQKEFFLNNHFVLKDSVVIGIPGVTEYGPPARAGTPKRTYLPWEVFNHMNIGTGGARLLRSISIELRADALEKDWITYTGEYVHKVYISWDGVGYQHDGGIPHHEVFQTLSSFRGLQEVEICGLEDGPELCALLESLMTSPASGTGRVVQAETAIHGKRVSIARLIEKGHRHSTTSSVFPNGAMSPSLGGSSVA